MPVAAKNVQHLRSMVAGRHHGVYSALDTPRGCASAYAGVSGSRKRLAAFLVQHIMAVCMTTVSGVFSCAVWRCGVSSWYAAERPLHPYSFHSAQALAWRSRCYQRCLQHRTFVLAVISSCSASFPLTVLPAKTYSARRTFPGGPVPFSISRWCLPGMPTVLFSFSPHSHHKGLPLSLCLVASLFLPLLPGSEHLRREACGNLC